MALKWAPRSGRPIMPPKPRRSIFSKFKRTSRAAGPKKGVFPSTRWPARDRTRYEACWTVLAGRLGTARVSEEGQRLLLLSGLEEYWQKERDTLSTAELREVLLALQEQFGFSNHTVDWLCEHYP